jgi:hypothetical protein
MGKEVWNESQAFVLHTRESLPADYRESVRSSPYFNRFP